MLDCSFIFSFSFPSVPLFLSFSEIMICLEVLQWLRWWGVLLLIDVCFMQWLRSLFSCCLLVHLCLVLYRKTKATHHFFCFVTCALCECVLRVKDWACYYVLQLAACINLFFVSTIRYGALIYRLGVSKQIILLSNHIWMSFQVLIGINTLVLRTEDSGEIKSKRKWK